MKLYKDNNEFSLRLGGCGCCAQTKALRLNSTGEVEPYDENLDWCEQITMEDVEAIRKYNDDQRKALNELERLLKPKPFTYDDIPF